MNVRLLPNVFYAKDIYVNVYLIKACIFIIQIILHKTFDWKCYKCLDLAFLYT